MHAGTKISSSLCFVPESDIVPCLQQLLGKESLHPPADKGLQKKRMLLRGQK